MNFGLPQDRSPEKAQKKRNKGYVWEDNEGADLGHLNMGPSLEDARGKRLGRLSDVS